MTVPQVDSRRCVADEDLAERANFGLACPFVQGILNRSEAQPSETAQTFRDCGTELGLWMTAKRSISVDDREAVNFGR